MKKILALVVTLFLVRGNTYIAMASELENDLEDSVSQYEPYIDADENQLFLEESDNKMLETEGNVIVENDNKKTNDLYENNDTLENAYLYTSIPTISNEITTAGTLYTLGYKAAILSSKTDIDWYKCNFSKGDVIFADIRNIGKKNLNIALYNQSGKCLDYSAKYPEFKARPEKYLDYIIPTNGTYYI